MSRFFTAVVSVLGWRLLAAVGLALALAATEGTGVLLLVPLLASIGLEVDGGMTGGVSAAIARAFATVGLEPTLVTVLGIFLAVAVAQALLYRAYLLMNPALEQRFCVALRTRLYAAIVSVDWSFFTRQRTNDLVHAATAEVDRAGTAVYQLLTVTTGLVVTLVYVAIAFRLSPALTTLVAAAGVVVLIATRGRARRSSELGEAYADANRRHFHMISESIAGLKVARSFGAERRDIALFGEHVRARTTAYLELLRSFARAKQGLDLVSAVMICALLFIAVEFFGVRGAGLLLLIFVFTRVMPRVMSLQESVQVLIAGLPAYASVMRVIDGCEAHAERTVTEDPAPLSMRRELRFEDVSYRYGDAAPAVSHVSLSIRAGATTAIVGASGAGKSTLADLMIGLLRPSTGRILIDGAPLTDEQAAAWRRSIGYVPQDSFLLHDSVRANLRWAKPGATDEAMWGALERSAAAGFLRARPEGLDTIVGDRGVRLSGGERQRLALARALLVDPAVLVLDEATSALDSVNETQILGAVRGLSGAVTTLIVTHRLSAIRAADFIYVMDAGRVVQAGSWHELSHTPGPFAILLAAQGLEPAAPTLA
jgi:ATP-binding cassette subfamily C protein